MAELRTTVGNLVEKLPRLTKDLTLFIAALSVFANFTLAKEDQNGIFSDSFQSEKERRNLLTPKQRLEILNSLVTKGEGDKLSMQLKKGGTLTVEKLAGEFIVTERVKGERRAFTGARDKINSNSRFIGQNIGDDVNYVCLIDSEGKLKSCAVGAMYQITENEGGANSSQLYAYYLREVKGAQGSKLAARIDKLIISRQ